jgi:hypothetical protein
MNIFSNPTTEIEGYGKIRDCYSDVKKGLSGGSNCTGNRTDLSEHCKIYCSSIDKLRSQGLDQETTKIALEAFPSNPPFELPGCSTANNATFNNHCWTRIITQRGPCYSTNAGIAVVLTLHILLLISVGAFDRHVGKDGAIGKSWRKRRSSRHRAARQAIPGRRIRQQATSL